MSLSIESKQSTSNSRKTPKAPLLSAEVIRALTPMFLALIGGAIGIAVLVMNANSAGFGLASTAIAGAAGLAQSKDANQKSE